MKAFGLFVLAKKLLAHPWTALGDTQGANALRLLSAALVFGLVTGCGGGSVTKSSQTGPQVIAFTSAAALDGSPFFFPQENNIWLVDADGVGASPLTRLTALRVQNDTLVWSPDGSKLGFISNRALDGSDGVNTSTTDPLGLDPADNLWVMNADGSGTMPLTRLTNVSAESVAWSPNGRQIAFSSDRALDGSDAFNFPRGANNIWVVNSDGTGAVPLTRFTEADNLSPVWSPDGSKIAFTSDRPLDGSDVFSPSAIDRVWIMNADGSGAAPVTGLTFPDTSSFHPLFSPDGTKLAFNFGHNIWVANLDGSQAFPLTSFLSASADLVAWSPDGKKIAFTLTIGVPRPIPIPPDLVNNVWVANADGSGATALTQNSCMGGFRGAHANGWSPDGAFLLFTSSLAPDGSGGCDSFVDVWIMRPDGSGAMPVSKVTGDSPAWRP